MQKQNKKKRGIGALLALTSITACLVAGTFAKYVTTGMSRNYARVAKFGVELEVEDNTMFNTSYNPNTDAAAEAGIETTITSSVEGEKVVGPGTGEKDSLRFSIKGKPEAEVKLEVNMDEDPSMDVFLKKGNYKDFTHAPYTDHFEITDENGYHPIAFTLKKITGATGETVETVVDGKTLADVNKYLKETVSKPTCAPNTDINESYTLSWKWKLGVISDADKLKNSADTLLGNIAADLASATEAKYTAVDGGAGSFSALENEKDYSTNLRVNLSIRVVQTPDESMT